MTQALNARLKSEQKRITRAIESNQRIAAAVIQIEEPRRQHAIAMIGRLREELATIEKCIAELAEISARETWTS